MKRPVGRPRVISKKKRDEITAALQIGSTYEIACSYARISYSAFNKWMTRARRELDRVRDEREAFMETLPDALEWSVKLRPKRMAVIFPKQEDDEDDQPNIVKTMPKATVKRPIPKKFPREILDKIHIQPKEREYVQFFHAITTANAVAATGWLNIIDTAANQDPNWAAWLLKTRYPAEYGGAGARSTSVEVKTPGGAADVAGQETIIKIVYQDYVSPITFQEESETISPSEPDP